MSRYILRNGQLVFNKPTINFELIRQDLQSQKSFRKQLLILYKNFYKLRYIVNQGKWSDVYLQRIRREFKYLDINTKRSKFSMEPIRQLEIVSRILNTLVFVFNSTVQTNDEYAQPMYFQDIAEIDKSNMENKIIKTILMMEFQIPREIKLDFQYRWLDVLNEQLMQIDEAKEAKKKKKPKLTLPMNVIGFKQYNQTMINFNESYKLCL